MVMLLLATLLCAKLVRSHSSHPLDGLRVSVERVISVVEHEGVLFHVTVDCENWEQA